MSEVSRFLNPKRLENARAHMVNSLLTLHEGNYYYGARVTDFGEMFRQISTAELNQDDVILCGFMRSGNHWCWEILHMICNETIEFTDRIWANNIWDIMDDKVHDHIKNLRSPRAFGTHLHPNLFPKDILTKPVKLIYTLRNPKDVLASWFKLASILGDGSSWTGDWDEFFQLQITGEFAWGSWFNHLNAFDAFMKEHPHVQVHVLQFEKLLENPIEEISALCRFLGKSDSLAEQIADVTSFAKMVSGTQEKANNENKEFTSKPGHVAMVSGKSKAWKSRFTVEQSEIVDQVFDEVLTGNTLADMVRPYME